MVWSPCLFLVRTHADLYQILSITNRGATPMRADAACATPGFYGAPVSGTGSHLRRHFSLSLEESPLQALKNAPVGSVFHTRHLHTPRTLTRAWGKPKKPSAFRGEANATLTRSSKHYPYHNSTGIDPILVLVRIAFAALAVRGGFFWPLAPQHAFRRARGAEAAGQ